MSTCLLHDNVRDRIDGGRWLGTPVIRPDSVGICVGSGRQGDDFGLGVDHRWRRWYGFRNTRDRRTCGDSVGTVKRVVGKPARWFHVRHSPFHAAAARFAFVAEAFVSPWVIIAFEAHGTEMASTKEALEGGEDVVMVLDVKKPQENVAVSVSGEQVGSGGIDDEDLVVAETGCHGDLVCELVGTPSTES